ncbi:hypothetical protein [Calothrix sp. NIES-2100]|uniref:hypothetical protein n=1 Tax=Calothrix sp. NIES-2100 TaxID=1954172 RepID=UPI000BBBA6FF
MSHAYQRGGTCLVDAKENYENHLAFMQRQKKLIHEFGDRTFMQQLYCRRNSDENAVNLISFATSAIFPWGSHIYN